MKGNSVTFTVEVEENDILDAGFHHEADCDFGGWHQDDDCKANTLEQGLMVMHTVHHEGPYRLCRLDPCRDVT